MSKIYFIVTIDTECDKSKDWSVRYPFEFKNILEGIPNRLQPLFRKHGIKPTYLLSPEVIADPNSARMLRNLDGEYELGTHLHGEFIEPEANFSANATDDFQADYGYDVEYKKMEMLTHSFKNTFGYQPISFRAGRFGIGRDTLRILKMLHYKVDSSIYPFSIIQTKRYVNNFYGYPIKPYYANVQTMSRRATTYSDSVLEVPMTVHARLFQTLPHPINQLISRSKLLLGILSKIAGQNLVKTFSLRPSGYDENILRGIIDAHIALHKKDEPIFLNMMFHSNEIYPGCSPYAQTEEEVVRILERIDKTILYVKQKKAESITLKDCCSILPRNDEAL